MPLVHRHNGCIGLTLFRWGRKKAEVWYCKKGEFIEPHSHPNIDSVIVMLAGEMWGNRDGFTRAIFCPVDFLHRFSLPAGTRHSAKVGRYVLFLNWETWKEGVPMTSAAEDFTAV